MANGTWLIIIIVIIVVIVLLAMSSNKKSVNSGSTLSTVLNGAQEIPTNLSRGAGIFRGNFVNANTLRYNLRVENLTGPPTGAHFHLGSIGQNGPILKNITLRASPSPNGTQLWVAEGMWSALDLQQPLNTALINELNRGNIYVNVHTAEYPDGEIRGQIVKS